LVESQQSRFLENCVAGFFVLIRIAVSQRLAYPLVSFGLIPLRSAVSFGWMNAPAF